MDNWDIVVEIIADIVSDKVYIFQEENEIGRSEVGFEKKSFEYESEKRVGIAPLKEEAEGLLHLGSSLLGMGTR